MLAGWHAFEGARLDHQRTSVERSLAQLAAPLAEQATLLRDAREREARVAQETVPETELVAKVREILVAQAEDRAKGL